MALERPFKIIIWQVDCSCVLPAFFTLVGKMALSKMLDLVFSLKIIYNWFGELSLSFSIKFVKLGMCVCLCACVCLLGANSKLAQGTRCAKEVCLLHRWWYRGSRPRVQLFRETGGDKGLPEVVPRIFDEDFVSKEKEYGISDCGDDDDNDKRSQDQPST